MDLSTTGHIVIAVSMLFAGIAMVGGIVAKIRHDLRIAAISRRALVAAAGFVLLSTALLVAALFSRDFSIAYVASYTSGSTSRLYTVTSLWAGMEGSLLWWTCITSVYAAGAVLAQADRRGDLVPIATAVLGGILTFFLAVLAFSANPFAASAVIPVDGSGLNPLLQSPFMAIHPVFLYLGLTGFAVPFAFAVSALVAGKLDVRWFTSTRRWTVVAWSFLTIGIILGAAWAYMELGWGGYWAWDPVENASFLPWLTGTAFLHSVMIQERRGMLKVWNVALILATYSLAIFGTFLTRSGLLQSVHTFSESPVGKYFLPFLGILMVGAFALLGMRIDKLRSRRHLDSTLSREAMFLFNNLLFVAIAFTVLWGTLYPVLVEAFNGQKISVGPPFFNSVVVPTGLALLALTGIGPLVAWRKATFKRLSRQLALPLLAGAGAVLALAAAGTRSWGAMTAIGLCSFVFVSTIGEFVSGALAHSQTAGGFLKGLVSVISRNRRRYGGYIVHLGVVLIFLGLSGSAFRQTWSGTLSVGQKFSIGSYTIEYAGAKSYATSEKMVRMAIMDVSRSGQHLTQLRPQRNFHIAQRQGQSEIGLRTSLSDDLYIVLSQMDDNAVATIRVWVNPLVIWIWIGGAVMATGMITILLGKPHEIKSGSTVEQARDSKVAVHV